MIRPRKILLLTLAAVGAALLWRSQHAGLPEQKPGLDEMASLAQISDTLEARPRLIELGSDSCASCQAMIPVLAELREQHGPALQVDFIDVWKHPDQAEPFGIRVIPTQIFQGPDGTELSRHEGFFAANAIRERWADLGFPLSSDAAKP